MLASISHQWLCSTWYHCLSCSLLLHIEWGDFGRASHYEYACRQEHQRIKALYSMWHGWCFVLFYQTFCFGTYATIEENATMSHGYDALTQSNNTACSCCCCFVRFAFCLLVACLFLLRHGAWPMHQQPTGECGSGCHSTKKNQEAKASRPRALFSFLLACLVRRASGKTAR